jgi:hypothetical protein
MNTQACRPALSSPGFGSAPIAKVEITAAPLCNDDDSVATATSTKDL